MALSPLQNLTVVYKETMMQGDVVDRKRLEDLHPEQYTSILILSDADNLGTVDSDSRCIAGALPVLCYLRESSVQLLACQAARWTPYSSKTSRKVRRLIICQV